MVATTAVTIAVEIIVDVEILEAAAAAVIPIIPIPAAVDVRKQEMNAGRRNVVQRIRAGRDSVHSLLREVHADAKNSLKLQSLIR